MLCQLLAEGGAQEGGFDQLLGGAAALLLEREQVDPLFELADAEDDQRLLDSFGKQVVAYQVNSPAARDLAQELSCEFTQGTCVAEQTASKVHRVDR